VISFDASVAAKLVLSETHSDKAVAPFTLALRLGDFVVAPTLRRFEIANIVRKRMVRNALSLEDADRILADFLQLPFTLVTPRELHREALALADAFGLPAAYDAHYVVLARMLGCDLWTYDADLFKSVGRDLPFVRRIEDYAPPVPSSV
jgi:predicted nucleic acid-binding protein